jgi:glycosyltransferase involved in cell wall biosynthesis
MRSGSPVELVGQKTETEMVRLYAAADLFVLPSLIDPSPLSPIEACAAQLPLLASRRIGNYDDVLEDGTNGWGFDADHPETQRERIAQIAANAARGARCDGGEVASASTTAGSIPTRASVTWRGDP